MAPRWTSDCIAARQLIDDVYDGNIDIDDKQPDTKAVWDSRDSATKFSLSAPSAHITTRHGVNFPSPTAIMLKKVKVISDVDQLKLLVQRNYRKIVKLE